MLVIAVAVVAFSLGCSAILVGGRLYRARGYSKAGWEDVEPGSFTQRALVMQTRHEEIAEQVEASDDMDTVLLLDAESQLILGNLQKLRAEQLECVANGWRRRRDDTLGAIR